jgi:hypothetical protein
MARLRLRPTYIGQEVADLISRHGMTWWQVRKQVVRVHDLQRQTPFGIDIPKTTGVILGYLVDLVGVTVLATYYKR